MDIQEKKIRLLMLNGKEFKEEEMILYDFLENFDRKNFAEDMITFCFFDTGIIDFSDIDNIGKKLDLHQLHVEDIKNFDHKEKIEFLDDILFLILKSPKYLEEEKEVHFTANNLIFKNGKCFFLFSESGNFIQYIIRKLKNNQISQTVDFVIYHFIDMTTDLFYPIIEKYHERLGDLEEKINLKANEDLLYEIHKVHKEINSLHQLLSQHKELISQIIKHEYSPLKNIDKEFLKDLIDHAHHLYEEAKELKEEISLIYSLFYSHLNIRMNASMKTLTQVATVLMPLTLIAGVYGMNFKNMPELEWSYGYYFILGVMVLLGLFLWRYIKRS